MSDRNVLFRQPLWPNLQLVSSVKQSSAQLVHCALEIALGYVYTDKNWQEMCQCEITGGLLCNSGDNMMC